MISGSSQLGNLRTRLNVIAGSLSTVCIAIVMLGPITFSALQYYYDVQNPSWVFWGALSSSCLIVFVLRRSTIRRTLTDNLMILFLLVIAASILFNVAVRSSSSAYLIGFFMVLPYIAGRLVNENELDLFILSTGLVATTGVVVSIIGLIDTDVNDIVSDRIRTLFARIDMHGVVLSGGDVIPHLSLAAGWIAIISFYQIIEGRFRRWKMTQELFFSTLLFISVFLLVSVGLRGTYVATLLTFIFLSGIAKSSLQRRAVGILFVLVVSLISFSSLSDERRDHYSGMHKTVAGLLLEHNGSHQGFEGFFSNPTQLNDSCRVVSDSLATRLLLFEKTKPLIEDYKAGVGVGLWGIYTGCSGHFGTPHNIILHALAELGIVGAILLMSIILSSFYRLILIYLKGSHQNLKSHILSAGFMVFILIISQFSAGHIYNHQFYALLGLFSGLDLRNTSDGSHL